MRVTKLRQKDSTGVFGEAIPIGTDAQYVTIENEDITITLDKALIDINTTVEEIQNQQITFDEALIDINTTVEEIQNQQITFDEALIDINTTVEEIQNQLESVTASVVWEDIN